MPKVSVILPVYNGEKYVREAVESVLDQTFPDFELIIIDDGSTDATSEILDRFSDSRIARLRNEKNFGLVGSLNKGLGESRGEFIARMDADDVSLPERFEKQVAYLVAHPEIGVLGTAILQTDNRGQGIAAVVLPETHEAILREMLSGLAVAHPTVMARRQVVLAAGGYNPNFGDAEDTELWSRLIFRTRFANLSQVLHRHRLHNQSVTSRQFLERDRLSRQIRK